VLGIHEPWALASRKGPDHEAADAGRIAKVAVEDVEVPLVE
jgi:hypothetical protein